MKHNNGLTIWMTGLSGAGKSTISELLVSKIRALDAKVEVLDRDIVRTNLSKGLGFSKKDREINLLRIAFVCRLLSRNGVIAIAAAISPYDSVRKKIRELDPSLIEIYINAPLEKCIERDVKGLYKKALSGEIQHFTGISDPYEPPEDADIEVNTDRESPDESTSKIFVWLVNNGYLKDDTLTKEIGGYPFPLR